MQQSPVPWNLREVLAVHLLRLLVGAFLVRTVYPGWFATQTVVEITDRLVMIGLVWLIVHRHGGHLGNWGLPGRRLVFGCAAGLGAGLVLLAVSIFSERIYTTVFYLTPSQHPLLAQVAGASSWRELALPLFLAGLAAPVAEEILYRLFTFSALKVRYGLWGGALGSAAVFALFHFNIYWLAELMVVGTGLALLYHVTGSLLSAVVAHSVINSTKIILLFLNLSVI
ncbi:MAG: type II CAAX endopeptidase family protein [Negativicutes bacterium]|nr:type II CAAX endopeptidase family protein [Negativicutes bacterium]